MEQDINIYDLGKSCWLKYTPANLEQLQPPKYIPVKWVGKYIPVKWVCKVVYAQIKKRRIQQLLGSGYGFHTIYEKLISEGYYIE